MNVYLVRITVNIPCPRQFDFKQVATGEGPATSRSLKELRKRIGRKQIKEWSIEIKSIPHAVQKVE
jgi:hypothetical protein